MRVRVWGEKVNVIYYREMRKEISLVYLTKSKEYDIMLKNGGWYVEAKEVRLLWHAI